jgi:hypothetical protein
VTIPSSVTSIGERAFSRNPFIYVCFEGNITALLDAFPPGTPVVCQTPSPSIDPTATPTISPTIASFSNPTPLPSPDPSFTEQSVQCVRPETDFISPAFCPRNLSAFEVASPISSADARVCKPHDSDDELRVESAHFAKDSSTTPATLIVRVSISTPDDVSINDNFRVVFKGFKNDSSTYKTVITSFKFNGNPLNKLTTFQLEAQLKPDMIEINEMSIKIKQRVVNGKRAFARNSCTRFPVQV